jgi:hypothetical protein
VAEASQTKIIRFATSDFAENMLDDAAIRIRLQGTGWQEEGGGTIQAFYPPHAGQHPFTIEASVDATGTARTRLVPEGTSRQMFWGVIPAGPTVPFGMEPFLRFVKSAGGATGVAASTRDPTAAFLTRSGERTDGWSPPTAPTTTRSNTDPTRNSEVATAPDVILAAFGAEQRRSFDQLDKRAELDLLVTLATLQDLVDGGHLLRDPGGLYRIAPSEGQDT